MFLINELISLLAANMILTRALGTSTLFIAAGSRKNLIATASVITLFTTFGSAAAYLVNYFSGEKYSNFIPLFYTLAVGMIYIILLAAFYFFFRKSFDKVRKYIHLSAFNCAVMGTLFTISESSSNAAEGMSFADFLLYGFESGAGFVLASLILSAAFGRLNSSRVPSSFRGFPAMLVYLGIISMAVYSLK